ARQDCLPTRVNLVRRGINVDSCVCPIRSTGEDEINHILFRCDLAQQVLRRICRWWKLDPSDWNTFQECADNMETDNIDYNDGVDEVNDVDGLNVSANDHDHDDHVKDRDASVNVDYVDIFDP
nr:RNA-directed DNA polymerase, eukaryota [Tanacetum cinerariifolium]